MRPRRPLKPLPLAPAPHRFVPPVPNPNISPDTSPDVSPSASPRGGDSSGAFPPKSPLYPKPAISKQTIGQSSAGFNGGTTTSTLPNAPLVPLDSVLDLLGCALCGLRFDKDARVPKQMPCSHTYCAACIDARIWQQQAEEAELRCPQQCARGVLLFRIVDGERVEPPVSSLPTNAFVYDLLDRLPAARTTAGAGPPPTAGGIGMGAGASRGGTGSGTRSAGGDGFSFVDGFSDTVGNMMAARQPTPTSAAGGGGMGSAGGAQFGATMSSTMGRTGGGGGGGGAGMGSLDSRPSSASATDVAMCEKHNMEIQNFCSSCEVRGRASSKLMFMRL